ncbi:hypothetical protein QAD02_004744 [Eretmocerus hayati]|uniref:Uncharacterized protein n=1 Tax=Eretmocerus hayati TaxID=131215 RepID=A0ACC2NTD5_9HYME|nr:hypothetical protein QAD02_004744 [Eretmocerus hayati]
MMACGYLRVIQRRLLSMSPSKRGNAVLDDSEIGEIGSEENLSTQEVTRCVIFHQKVVKFCREINHFMQSFFVIMVLCTVYNLSLISLQLLENDGNFFKYVTLLALNFLQLYICQWGPEQLLTESEAVGEAAYSAALAHGQINIRANKMLLLVMMRAQRPAQLTAGGYINLSMETFGNMIKSAFSFFTVARNLYD